MHSMNGHERPLLHSTLARLPSVNASSCGAVQVRYYLDFDDSRNDPDPARPSGRTRVTNAVLLC
jgi:hypothetical protein